MDSTAETIVLSVQEASKIASAVVSLEERLDGCKGVLNVCTKELRRFIKESVVSDCPPLPAPLILTETPWYYWVGTTAGIVLAGFAGYWIGEAL